jgi:hypothetical protein
LYNTCIYRARPCLYWLLGTGICTKTNHPSKTDFSSGRSLWWKARWWGWRSVTTVSIPWLKWLRS